MTPTPALPPPPLLLLLLRDHATHATYQKLALKDPDHRPDPDHMEEPHAGDGLGSGPLMMAPDEGLDHDLLPSGSSVGGTGGSTASGTGDVVSCPPGMDVAMMNANGAGCTFCAMFDECEVSCVGSAVCQCPGEDDPNSDEFKECCDSEGGKCCDGCPEASNPECNVSSCSSEPESCSTTVCPGEGGSQSASTSSTSTPSCPPGMSAVMMNANGVGCNFCAMTTECEFSCVGPAACTCGVDPDSDEFKDCCESEGGKCCDGCPDASTPECNVSSCSSEPESCSTTVCPGEGGSQSASTSSTSTPSCPPGMSAVMMNANGVGCNFCAMTTECEFSCVGPAACTCGVDPDSDEFKDCCESEGGKCCDGCPDASTPECNVSSCSSEPESCSTTVCPAKEESAVGTPLLRINKRSEKRRWRRAWRRWKMKSRNRRYIFQVSENNSSFSRTNGEKMSMQTLFQDIMKLLNTQTEFSDFKIKYNKRLGYPRLIKWEYSDGTSLQTKMIKSRRLRFQRKRDPVEPISGSSLNFVKKKRRVWRRSRVGSSGRYKFTFRQQCDTCPPDALRVTVYNGEVREPTVYAESLNEVYVGDDIKTVDDILNELVAGLDGGWENYSVDLEFSSRGYPTKVYMGSTSATDAGRTIYISDVKYAPETCPAQAFAIGATCESFGHSCYYGQESCCDKTYVSLLCRCEAVAGGDDLGEYACLATDSCFIPQCNQINARDGQPQSNQVPGIN
eukprot:CAMPEP_0178730184 /NCGR_PEP_ID=MMETSP0699-20121125/29381_1 /TAXON_ID=265572 /ORGANISM="Extubocellulus spinifer, Strain CCMP396" /LENGTH=731 /DNA_ID=CAMNT_0020382187 /DNA_START=87 /DNA_END=2283 /DNA_ORIENTATION=+